MIEISGLDGIGGLDGGRVNEAFRAKLRAILDDIRDRPTCKDPRTLTLSLRLIPVTVDGELADVRFGMELAHCVPKSRSRIYSGAIVADKARPIGLVFNDLSAGDVRQRTLDEIEHRTETNG